MDHQRSRMALEIMICFYIAQESRYRPPGILEDGCVSPLPEEPASVRKKRAP